MQTERDKWNQRYQSIAMTMPAPAAVLADNQHLLPGQPGTALDLACGLGGNALFLAKQGWQVNAWDSAENAILQLKTRVQQAGLQQLLTAQQRDVVATPPAPETFDVIVISHFLDRRIFPALQQALKPGGLLFYQTFCRDKPEHIGPGNLEYLLAQNELLFAFPGLIIRVYREEGQIGCIERGWRYRAMLVAQRPIDT